MTGRARRQVSENARHPPLLSVQENAQRSQLSYCGGLADFPQQRVSRAAVAYGRRDTYIPTQPLTCNAENAAYGCCRYSETHDETQGIHRVVVHRKAWTHIYLSWEEQSAADLCAPGHSVADFRTPSADQPATCIELLGQKRGVSGVKGMGHLYRPPQTRP